MSVRVKLTAFVTLPDEASPAGFADSVFTFLEGLGEPAPLFVHGCHSDIASDEDADAVWQDNLDHPIGTEGEPDSGGEGR